MGLRCSCCMSLGVEAFLLIAGAVLSVCAWRTVLAARKGLVGYLRIVTISRRRTVLCSFLLPLVVLPALTLRTGVPQPNVHDEFVYLLIGDTFARGRLTNEPPADSEHFRSPHVLMSPTYQGKYPPAQGLFLAAGQVLMGMPIAGVWLSFAAASASVCWMMQGVAPNRWSLLAGVLFSLHPMISIAWGETYWGGAVAASGGALMFGSLARLDRRSSMITSLVLGLSVVVLAASRPFEGGLLSVVGAVWFLRCLFQHGWRDRIRVIVPATAIIMCGAGAMAIYNHAVTGDAWKMPYQAWVEQHATRDSIASIVYQTGSIRDIVDVESGRLNMSSMQFKAIRHHFFFLRFALIVPLLAVPWILRRKHTVPLLAGYGIVYGFVITNSYPGFPHYFAPATPLLCGLIVQGVRQMSAFPGRLQAFAGVSVAVVLSSGVGAMWAWSDVPYTPDKQWVYARRSVEVYLESRADRSLVIVQYSADRDPGDEWVWNSGDLDVQHVVWAHSLSSDADHHLVAGRAERTAWVLDVGKTSCRLRRITSELHVSGEEVVFAFHQGTTARKRRIAGSPAIRNLTAADTREAISVRHEAERSAETNVNK